LYSRAGLSTFAFDNFLHVKKSTQGEVGKSTLGNYANYLRRYVGVDIGMSAGVTLSEARRFGDLLVSAVKPQDVIDLYDALRSETPEHKALGVATIQALHDRLSAMFEYALQLEWVDHSVISKSLRPKGKSAPRANITDIQAAHFIETADAQAGRLADAFEVLALSGMRRGELLALRWRDVDLDGGWLWVTGSMARVNGSFAGRSSMYRKSPKSAASYGQVRIDDAMKEAFIRQAARQDRERASFKIDPAKFCHSWRWVKEAHLWAEVEHDHDETCRFVFASSVGGPIDFEVFGRCFRSVRNGAFQDGKATQLTPHGLRHSFASITAGRQIADTGKVDYDSIATMLRHSDPKVTREVYVHLEDDLVAAAARKVWERSGDLLQ
jgi:integrase